MSYWTHVNGSIRVDSTPLKEKETKTLFKTCKFDSSIKDWKTCNVPRGPEGSLQVLLHFNHDKYEACKITITTSVLTAFRRLWLFSGEAVDNFLERTNDIIHKKYS